MPTHKPSLALLTTNQLSQLTGRSYRFIKAALAGLEPASKTGRSLLYRPQEALPLIYAKADGLDLNAERARLAAVQADRQTLALRCERSEVIEMPAAVRFWQSCITASRARLLALPSRIASEVPVSEDTRAAVSDVAQRLVYEALHELADMPASAEIDGILDAEIAGDG
jgi:phage terminase Nu1 subunit (DNA packaging protein)